MKDERTRSRMTIAGLIVATVVVWTFGTSSAGGTLQVYLTVDTTQLVTFASALTKVSVANPAIADVHVVSPTRILVNGKTPGVTSLVVFRGASVEQVDIVVHPAPTVTPRAPLLLSEGRAVEVHRGASVSHQLFVPDADGAWVQLGVPAKESEAVKK